MKRLSIPSKNGGFVLAEYKRMINLSNFEMRKKKVRGIWSRVDLDKKQSQFRLLSTTEKI